MEADVLSGIVRELGREMIALVPHWYTAPCGPNRYSLVIDQTPIEFCDHFELTPAIAQLLEAMLRLSGNLPLDKFSELPGLTDVLLEHVVIEWLKIHSSLVNWPRLLKFLGGLVRRTNENNPVLLNLLIRPGEGHGDVTQPSLQKFLDQIASSPCVYLAVDPELRLLDYAEVSHERKPSCQPSGFVPSFLQPVHQVMAADDIVAHATPFGDIVIMNQAGVLAMRRQGRWKLVDVHAFRRTVAHCLGHDVIAANLLEDVLELSFARRGGLFIYDPLHCMKGHILNPESIIAEGWLSGAKTDATSGQSVFARLLKSIPIGALASSNSSKRRLLELAAVDGAVVFDDRALLAVGALVESHPLVGNQLGARTTAARSAYMWGGLPTAVSSDGEITMYFQSEQETERCDAVLRF